MTIRSSTGRNERMRSRTSSLSEPSRVKPTAAAARGEDCRVRLVGQGARSLCE